MCRVESFIEHQDACNMGRLRPDSQPPQQPPPVCLSRTASSPSPSSETNFSTGPHWHGLVMPKPNEPTFLNPTTTAGAGAAETASKKSYKVCPNLDLRLSTTTSIIPIDITAASPKGDETRSTHLQLSIGSSEIGEKNESNSFVNHRNSPKESINSSDKPEGKPL